MKKLTILGASGHGKVCADIAEKNGYDNIVFLDDDRTKTTCGKWPVIGRTDQAKSIQSDLFVAIGDAEIREHLMNRECVTLIHPNAVIADDAIIGDGTVVMAGAVINPGARVGRGAIINTCSSVDHECELGDYVHVSVGAHLSGKVIVGNKTWIGAGVTVRNDISICRGCMIGTGAVVIKDIDTPGTYIGVPACRIPEDGI